MKIEEGPAFGAIIIGAGVGYFVYESSQNMRLAMAAGIAIGVADYFLLLWISQFKKK